MSGITNVANLFLASNHKGDFFCHKGEHILQQERKITNFHLKRLSPIPGILNYQPVSRSIHNLDQIYNPTFSRSEVIPVQNDGGHGLSGRALQDNALIQVQSGRDVHGAYTSRDAVSVPLHVGFQVEDPPAGTYRMNPKGKVLNLDDSNGAAADNRYVRKMVARQPSVVARQQNKGKVAQVQSDLSLAESAHEPFAVFGQKGEWHCRLFLNYGLFKVSKLHTCSSYGDHDTTC
jgi:hypothetical protein